MNCMEIYVERAGVAIGQIHHSDTGYQMREITDLIIMLIAGIYLDENLFEDEII